MKLLINTIFLFLLSSHAFAWDRFDMVDDFSGEKSFGYLQKSSNNSGGYFILSCDKKLKIEWDRFGDYAASIISKSSYTYAPQAPAAGYDGSDTILIKYDEDPVRREKWLFDNLHGTFSQQNTAKFLAQIKNKSVLKLKNENTNQVGVFDMSDLNQVVSTIKVVCN
jgi:hypothetical protein